MKERPSWLKVHEGGKGNPAQKPEQAAPAAAPQVERSSKPEEVIRPEELMFSLRGNEWEGTVAGASEERTEVSMESDLVRLYLDLSANPPADFGRSVRPERVRDFAAGLRGSHVASLHTYLSSAEVWKRPSYTQAVFEEVRARMLLGKMDPRE